MLVEAGEVGTYIAGANITGAIDLDLDAVKLVKANGNDNDAREVIESTDGATRFEVVGAIESIGPPQTSQTDVTSGETVGVRKKKIVQLILKGGSGAVSFHQPLGAAANGKVKPLGLPASVPDENELLVIAVAEAAVDADDDDQAVLAELKVQ